MSNNPYQPTQPGFGQDQGGHFGPPPSGGVQGKVGAAAIALLVVAVINIILALVNVISNAMFMLGMRDFDAFLEEYIKQMIEFGVEPKTIELMSFYFENLDKIGVGMGLLALIFGGLIFLGALRMRSMRSYGLSLFASIVVMIPCLSSCCLIGLPIGIWCLVVLLDGNVKRSFR